MRSPPHPFPRASSPVRQPAAHDDLPLPRLWRSRSDRVLAGVLGGLAEKFGWDPRPLRLLYGIATVGTMGMVLIPYLVVWAITGTRGLPRPSLRFWRSRTDKVVSGVLGGLAERWGINAFVLRGLYAAGTVLTGFLPGIVTYLVLWTGTPPLGEPDTEAHRLHP